MNNKDCETMTDEIKEVPQEEQASMFIGAKLKSARESIGLSIKDVCFQLRLSEEIIQCVEQDQLPGKIPLAFARGYLRTYGKFLNLPENEISEAIKTLLPEPKTETISYTKTKKTKPIINNQRIMQLTTSFIAITLVGLVVSWWFNHSPKQDKTPLVAENISQQLIQLPTEIQLSDSTKSNEINAEAPKLDIQTISNNTKVAINLSEKPQVAPTVENQVVKPEPTQLQAASNNKVTPENKPLHLASNQKTSPVSHDDFENDDDEYYEDDME